MTGQLRTLTWDDFEAFYKLYGIEYVEKYGGFTMSSDEVKAEMEMPRFDLTTDVAGIFKEDELVAYAEIRYWRTPPVRPYLYGYVHVDHRNKGYGTQLTEWGVARATEFLAEVPPEARVVLQAFTQVAEGKQLFEDFRFVNTRQSWMMQIDFTQAPSPATLPEGMRFVTMADGASVEDIARLHIGTFRDHRGFQEEPLADVVTRWEKIIEGTTDFDPTLFAIVKDGDADVALITIVPTSSDDADKGEVSILGVMPEYRKRGIGLQLLNFAFDALYRRGKKSCELNVDASSLTGATRLYERAGMYKSRVFYAYELELRGGVELSNQG